jgi:hypothetical protein
VTEKLLSQQLESPSGTGRVEPRSEISLSATDTNQRDANRPTHSHWQIWRGVPSRSAHDGYPELSGRRSLWRSPMAPAIAG